MTKKTEVLANFGAYMTSGELKKKVLLNSAHKFEHQ